MKSRWHRRLVVLINILIIILSSLTPSSLALPYTSISQSIHLSSVFFFLSPVLYECISLMYNPWFLYSYLTGRKLCPNYSIINTKVTCVVIILIFHAFCFYCFYFCIFPGNFVQVFFFFSYGNTNTNLFKLHLPL